MGARDDAVAQIPKSTLIRTFVSKYTRALTFENLLCRVFHLEDDWLFDGTGGFIQDSLDILLDNPLCFQVHLRERASAIHPLHATLFQSTRRRTWYRRLVWDWASNGHKLWHGFSMGPGLRRTELLRVLGPMESFGSELLVQASFQSLGLWAAALETGVLDHTGQHDSKRHEWETSI